MPPHPRLRHLVRMYWQVEEFHGPGQEEHRFMPEHTVRLTFFSGDSWQAGAGPDSPLERLPGATLTGMLLSPRRLVSVGLTRALGVELYPWGARQLFGWSMEVQGLDLTPVSAPVSRAVPALLRAGAWAEARDVLDDWLLERLSLHERELGPAVQAAAALYASLGTARIGALAQELNVSPRHLERGFAHEVGVNAKTLARLIRFEEAHNRLYVNPDEPLAGLAVDLGFADQAHLTREFRALAHMTPGSFAAYARQMTHVHDALNPANTLGSVTPVVAAPRPTEGP
ncbi:AraC family transcriptional regulator [Deinococcus multiflagellatus]|uniref:Helix-turn-helix domain-containing protein n=1 Tax=Deinococcus multiflagellatus TaxID=1656887 RepID=A0ABW1ZM80_9DEIO|nr:helix-turn-helix domain-containing protein [Deinococcus multiflagellatus]MBZ9714800.1 helix-turn-helix domain-containing protein [Deinococcus multiflagellatus]